MKADPRVRPAFRERLLGEGADSLIDSDLVALVLGHGRAGEPVGVLARRLLATAQGLPGLVELEPRELEQLPGLGPARAARLLAAFELGRRIWRPRVQIGQTLASPRDAARHFHGLLRDRRREEFHALLLDARNRVLGQRLISVGSLQASIVHPREVFRSAVRTAAASVVVAHNHPSGDATPSTEDRAVTQRLRESGTLLGIELLDHLVVGEREFFSFAEDRLLTLDHEIGDRLSEPRPPPARPPAGLRRRRASRSPPRIGRPR